MPKVHISSAWLESSKLWSPKMYPIQKFENFKNAKCRVATLCDYNALIEYATENSLVGSEDLKLLYQWRENPAEWGNLVLSKD